MFGGDHDWLDTTYGEIVADIRSLDGKNFLDLSRAHPLAKAKGLGFFYSTHNKSLLLWKTMN